MSINNELDGNNFVWWEMTNCGEHFVMNINVESLCSTADTNVILYMNYTST